ncbi:MAG: hypothetical protein ACI92G_001673 [Candidatus Pelagisphaera sp.]|jgi:hypothetical protein
MILGLFCFDRRTGTLPVLLFRDISRLLKWIETSGLGVRIELLDFFSMLILTRIRLGKCCVRFFENDCLEAFAIAFIEFWGALAERNDRSLSGVVFDF